jgi:hypothetical protein
VSDIAGVKIVGHETFVGPQEDDAMFRRMHRITFRLSPDEFERYHALVRPTHHRYDWSTVIREALEALWLACGAPRPISLSDGRSAVRQPGLPLFETKKRGRVKEKKPVKRRKKVA